MLVSETHFTNKNYIRIPNYSIYTTNHPNNKAHGGTAIIIKTSIKHHEIDKYHKEFLQATSIMIEDWSGPLVISAIYSPPKYAISQQLYTEFFESLGHRFIAGGDYNAKHPWWGSRSPTPNAKGRQLYETILSNNLSTISTGEPTYWPSDSNKLPDLIDFAVSKGLNPFHVKAQSSLKLTSDHSPILVTVETKISLMDINNKLHNKNTDWTEYKTYINSNLTCNVSLKKPDELEDEIEKFNILIHRAISAFNSGYE
ncbi:RTJK polymerase, partial [Acromyrmex insinuator]